MQIQISWLLQKPTDLNLHCFQRQGISGFSRTRVNQILAVFFFFFFFLICYPQFSLAPLISRTQWLSKVEFRLEHSELQGPVVQSIVSLTTSLVIKTVTVLVNTISNSQVFLLKKWEQLLQMQKLLTFFSAKIIASMPYAIFNDQSFNDMLTNNIVSFETGPWPCDPKSWVLTIWPPGCF